MVPRMMQCTRNVNYLCHSWHETMCTFNQYHNVDEFHTMYHVSSRANLLDSLGVWQRANKHASQCSWSSPTVNAHGLMPTMAEVIYISCTLHHSWYYDCGISFVLGLDNRHINKNCFWYSKFRDNRLITSSDTIDNLSILGALQLIDYR